MRAPRDERGQQGRSHIAALLLPLPARLRRTLSRACQRGAYFVALVMRSSSLCHLRWCTSNRDGCGEREQGVAAHHSRFCGVPSFRMYVNVSKPSRSRSTNSSSRCEYAPTVGGCGGAACAAFTAASTSAATWASSVVSASIASVMCQLCLNNTRATALLVRCCAQGLVLPAHCECPQAATPSRTAVTDTTNSRKLLELCREQ